jgi:hypothetical protein
MSARQFFAAGLLLVSFSCHAGLVHQYRFDGSLADDIAGPSIVSLGGTVAAGHYVFGMNEGLVLNENLGAQYTLDFVYNLASQTSYRKLVDFAAGTSDNGVYTLNGQATLFINGPLGGGAAIPNNTDSQLTVTRTGAGVVNAYLNKQLVLTHTDSSNALVFGNVARFFMDDGVQGSEASSGEVDFLRIYDTALTGQEVGNLANPLGPGGNVVPEPASAALMMAGIGMLGLARRRQRVR